MGPASLSIPAKEKVSALYLICRRSPSGAQMSSYLVTAQQAHKSHIFPLSAGTMYHNHTVLTVCTFF